MTWAGQGLSFLFPHDGAGARSQDLPRLVTHNRRAGLYLSLSLHTVCVESPWQSLSKEQPPPTWNSLTWGGGGIPVSLVGHIFLCMAQKHGFASREGNRTLTPWWPGIHSIYVVIRI